MRRFSQYLLLFLAVVMNACAEASSEARPMDAVATFDDRYPLLLESRLEQDDENFIGMVQAVGSFQGDLVLVDAIEGNVKLYDRDGTLRSVIGRPGDGPGEFRSPAAVLELEDRIVVRDNRHHRVTFFTTQGDVAAEWGFGVAAGRAMTETPEGGIILVGVPTADIRARTDGVSMPFHVFSPTGEHRYSFGPSHDTYRGIQRSTESEHVIRVGSHLVTGARSSDTVRVWREGEREPLRTFTVGSTFYRSPEWPDELPDHTPDWIREQMWLHGMMPLTDSTFLAWFVATADDDDDAEDGDPDDSRAVDWWYVEAHLDGRIESVARGTGDVPAYARGDTLWTVRWQPDGAVDLAARSLNGSMP